MVARRTRVQNGESEAVPYRVAHPYYRERWTELRYLAEYDDFRKRDLGSEFREAYVAWQTRLVSRHDDQQTSMKCSLGKNYYMPQAQQYALQHRQIPKENMPLGFSLAFLRGDFVRKLESKGYAPTQDSVMSDEVSHALYRLGEKAIDEKDYHQAYFHFRVYKNRYDVQNRCAFENPAADAHLYYLAVCQYILTGVASYTRAVNFYDRHVFLENYSELTSRYQIKPSLVLDRYTCCFSMRPHTLGSRCDRWYATTSMIVDGEQDVRGSLCLSYTKKIQDIVSALLSFYFRISKCFTGTHSLPHGQWTLELYEAMEHYLAVFDTFLGNLNDSISEDCALFDDSLLNVDVLIEEFLPLETQVIKPLVKKLENEWEIWKSFDVKLKELPPVTGNRGIELTVSMMRSQDIHIERRFSWRNAVWCLVAVISGHHGSACRKFVHQWCWEYLCRRIAFYQKPNASSTNVLKAAIDAMASDLDSTFLASSEGRSSGVCMGVLIINVKSLEDVISNIGDCEMISWKDGAEPKFFKESPHFVSDNFLSDDFGRLDFGKLIQKRCQENVDHDRSRLTAGNQMLYVTHTLGDFPFKVIQNPSDPSDLFLQPFPGCSLVVPLPSTKTGKSKRGEIIAIIGGGRHGMSYERFAISDFSVHNVNGCSRSVLVLKINV